ncbi:MAG TPA: NADPH-dependent assimilatory sulfite reductase hemoprotein subunit, partial [Ktedonobacterales bacterium]|nr:NADPH-dependent assimilatory sulfite reductase hemoprotein subunit [Ktedonobacterales bacterium]
ADPHPLMWEGTDDHLGWHQQPDGHWFLGLHVLNGRIADTPRARLRSGLRAAVKRFQPGVHLTTLQNILLTGLAASQRAPLEKVLARYGIATDPESIGVVRDALACPALPTCGLALAEAERALPAVVDQIQADLNDLGLNSERISIRMTGCPNGCARPYMGDIGIVGRSKDLYNISVGGDWSSTRMNELYAASVRLDEIAATIRPLLMLWRDGRSPGEAFGDFCARIGIATLRSLVAEQPAAVPAAEPVAS